MAPNEFVKKYLFDAVQSHVATGVPFMVTLAQAALESSWGEKAPGNNFFGVKAGLSWKGETQLLWTKEFQNGKWEKVQASFRKYLTPAQSFADHGLLLKKRWPKAFLFADPIGFIRSVQNDHEYKYATDPNYVVLIQKLVDQISKIILEMEK